MGQKLKEQASKAVTSGPISAKARGGSVDDRGEGSPGFAVDQENQGLSEVDPPGQACEGLDYRLHRSAEVRPKCSQRRPSHGFDLRTLSVWSGLRHCRFSERPTRRLEIARPVEQPHVRRVILPGRAVRHLRLGGRCTGRRSTGTRPPARARRRSANESGARTPCPAGHSGQAMDCWISIW